MTTSATCSACGEELIAGAHYCEACGAETGARSDTTVTSAAGEATAAGASTCATCGGSVGADGYCTSCGLRAIEDITVEDQGHVAYATHRGRRHHRNEDAAALATTREGWPVLVVADGVSASPNPHLAAAAAVGVVADELGDRPFGGPDDLVRAVAAAHRAACDVPADGDPQWIGDGTRPACTIVVAVATAGMAHVANVGDARAFRLASGDGWSATQLSTDDSMAALAVREGIDPDTALALPGGHAITAWLGADAPDTAVHLASHPTGPGDVLLACSDGLWNYAPTDAAMTEQVEVALPAPLDLSGATAKACEELVSWAIDRGGMDNICVALALAPPPTGKDDRS